MIVILTGSAAGFLESRKLSLHVELLEDFLRFLHTVQTEVRFSALPADQIVERHLDSFKKGLPFLTVCCQKFRNGAAFPDAWREAVGEKTSGWGLEEQDREIITAFGEQFGASDVDGQLTHCSLYIELTKAQLEAAKEKKRLKSRLYMMLGIFSGLGTALLLS